ncbi:hypothetical protein [Vibrio cincinnatiensis]|uniref:hypothetical protein n=1 Tax=Vibrio cincinnatiensis TaxID=675 RepID=UPI001EE04AB0|nr:hypothetical protein [Vibrio cincinnatiensis]MCG3740670.1 hypothetical protein [Vibrio cincinnatiensis]
MKDNDITVVDAIKNTKLSSIKKLAWMLWRLLVLLSLVLTLAAFYQYTLGDNSIIFYFDYIDEWNVLGLLLSGCGIVLSLTELKTGSVSAFIIKFLTKNPQS